jgi:hypothetical protein
MEGAAEIGARERNGKRKAKARLVQLIDRDNRERSRLCLLFALRRIGVGPVDVPLLGRRDYHSGVKASKAHSISRLSAR